MDPSTWERTLSAAYEDLREGPGTDEECPLDDGAAEDPGEFFAAVSEAFFTAPGWLRRAYPDVYEQLRLFYRQDPGARDGAATPL
jgi:hypothetical protein